jgi:DNA topoisomerase IB
MFEGLGHGAVSGLGWLAAGASTIAQSVLGGRGAEPKEYARGDFTRDPVRGPLNEEKLREGPARIPNFLPFYDPQQTIYETAEMRTAYRLMLNEPNVKGAFLGKILPVMARTMKVHPAVRTGERHKKVAEFCQWNLERRLHGGISHLAWNILSHACVDGVSINEKVWAVHQKGRYAGKRVLRQLKPKDLNHDVTIVTDEYRNTTGLMGLRYNAGTIFNPQDFAIYRHLPFFDVPNGMSDLRAAYARHWMLDTVSKLRAMGAEKRALPIIYGEYPDPSKQSSLERAMALIKLRNWLAVPKDTKLQVLDIAGQSDSYFSSFRRDCQEEIFLSIQGSTLQALSAAPGSERGSSEVHQDQSQPFKWHLAQAVCMVLNDGEWGLLVDLCDYNFLDVGDYPYCTFTSTDDDSLATSITVDRGLQEMGFEHSKEDMAERYGRPIAVDETDKLTPPAAGGAAAGVAPSSGLPPTPGEKGDEELEKVLEGTSPEDLETEATAEPGMSGFAERFQSFRESLGSLGEFLDGYVTVRGFPSSNVSAFRYQRGENQLYVRYKNGQWYEYDRVSPAEAAGLYNANSKGKWVWDRLRIRGTVFGFKKPYRRLGTTLPPRAFASGSHTFAEGWQEQLHPRDKGQFATKSGPGGNGHPNGQGEAPTSPATTVADVHGKASSVAAALTKRAGNVLGTIGRPGRWIRGKVKNAYGRLEQRYGPKMAVAIVGAGLVGLPLPVPGSSVLTAAPVIAMAELYRRVRGRFDEDEAELDPAEVDRLGKAFAQHLVRTWHEQTGKATEFDEEFEHKHPRAKGKFATKGGRGGGAAKPPEHAASASSSGEVFHGTAGQFAKSIRENGLKPGNAVNGRGVYVTSDLNAALSYAASKAHELADPVKYYGDPNYRKRLRVALVVIDNSSGAVSDFHGSVGKTPRAIAPRLIKEIRIYDYDELSRAKDRSKVTPLKTMAEGNDGYAVMLFEADDAPEQFDEGWREELHPRSHGKFAKKGQGKKGGEPAGDEWREGKRKATRGDMIGAKRVGTGKDAKLVMADGSKPPAHIKPASIPPDWTDVEVSTDPESEVRVQARDNKGRVKTLYKPSYTGLRAEVKFSRTWELLHKWDAVQAEIHKDRKVPDYRDHADCAWLMSEHGIRPGSTRETGGAVKAYGATTLRAQHVVETPRGARLVFVGKKGVRQSHLVTNPELSKMLLDRKRAAEKDPDDDRLFPYTNDSYLRQYMRALDGGGFESKDMRTARANIVAMEMIHLVKRPPKDEQDYKKKVKMVAEAVSKVLGNRPAEAIKSYINPAVFSAWRASAGV